MDAMPSAVSHLDLASPARQALRGPVRRVPGESVLLAPQDLHPALWLRHQPGRNPDQAVASGFAMLDAQLPRGGWPRRALTELLLPHPAIGQMRLLSPSHIAAQQARRLGMEYGPAAHSS